MARVLIVEDTEIVRRAMELAVRRMGHDAESTSIPEQALELASERPPDLLVLDFRMPGMDGVELWDALRERLGARCPKIVFVSGSPPDEVRERAERGPQRPVGYVKKPFHLDDLSRMVTKALAA